MRSEREIAIFSGQPITHQMLIALLKDYQRPNDKIHELANKGVLEPVKRGLYIVGRQTGLPQPEPFLLANHILGPSYVSMDSALSYYGLIPERVYEISSATTKVSKRFNTPAGVFSFIRLTLPYYAFGIRQVVLSENQHALLASPEKALFDKVVTTAGVLLRSTANAKHFLLEDLRMDEIHLRELDLHSMKIWAEAAPKKESLLMIIKAIENL